MHTIEQLLQLIVMLMGLTAAFWQLLHTRRKARLARLAAFQRALEGGTLVDELGRLTVEGRRDGRAVRLVLEGRTIVYQVAIPGWGGPALSIGASEAQLLANAPGAHARETAGADKHLFLVSDRLEASAGWLTVRRPATHYAQSLGSLTAVFDALERVAPAFSRTSVEVRVSGVACEVRAWSAGGQVLCPFCRDALAGDDAIEVAECDRCGTAQHADCMSENGGCAVFGCAATIGAERASRAR